MNPLKAFLGTVEVPEGNTFRYGQDFRFLSGIPPGQYHVYQFAADGYKLIAPGYGMQGNYGNGALLISGPANPEFAQLIQRSTPE